MSIEVDELQLITGIDIPVAELGLTLRQPKIKDIAILGESNYFLALSIFKMSKDKIKITNPEITSWVIFNESLSQQIEGVNVRLLILNFLQLFCLEKINIGPRSLMISKPDGIINIEPQQFDDFQGLILEIGGASLFTIPEEEFKPRNKRAADIAEKMKKSRARLAALQPKSNSKGFLTTYIRSVATVTANSLEQVCNMTLLQLNNIMQTFRAWESYDLEVKNRLAGAKVEGNLEHWMARSLEMENNSIGTI
jgi:hypothetical protein